MTTTKLFALFKKTLFFFYFRTMDIIYRLALNYVDWKQRIRCESVSRKFFNILREGCKSRTKLAYSEVELFVNCAEEGDTMMATDRLDACILHFHGNTERVCVVLPAKKYNSTDFARILAQVPASRMSMVQVGFNDPYLFNIQ